MVLGTSQLILVADFPFPINKIDILVRAVFIFGEINLKLHTLDFATCASDALHLAIGNIDDIVAHLDGGCILVIDVELNFACAYVAMGRMDTIRACAHILQCAFINNDLAIFCRRLVAIGIRCRIRLGYGNCRHCQVHIDIFAITVSIRCLDGNILVGWSIVSQLEAICAISILGQRHIPAGVFASRKRVDIRTGILTCGILPAKSGFSPLHEHFNLVTGSCIGAHCHLNCIDSVGHANHRHIVMNFDLDLALGPVVARTVCDRHGDGAAGYGRILPLVLIMILAPCQSISIVHHAFAISKADAGLGYGQLHPIDRSSATGKNRIAVCDLNGIAANGDRAAIFTI